VAKSSAEVRPRGGRFEVVPSGHRRGPTFGTCEEAITHAEGLAHRILVMNRTGKVERTLHSRGNFVAQLDPGT
jgi:hypothetical protein